MCMSVDLSEPCARFRNFFVVDLVAQLMMDLQKTKYDSVHNCCLIMYLERSTVSIVCTKNGRALGQRGTNVIDEHGT